MKTMILVSEGFVMGDEQASVLELGSLSAARANQHLQR